MKKWKLDDADVQVLWGGSYRKTHGDPSATKRSVDVKLVHRATGISVSQSTPLDSMSRPEATRAREQLKIELFAKLEELVAKHLLIPGRH